LPKLATQPRGGPERWQTLSQRGGQWGVEGAAPPPRGFGGCAPKFSKKGKAANSCHPATRGTQDAGEPSAYGGGPRGVQGAKPPGRGLWGVSPPQIQKRGRVAQISHPATRGPRTLANPKPTGVGKPGGQGAKQSPSMGRLLRRLKPPRNDLKSEKEPDLPGKA